VNNNQQSTSSPISQDLAPPPPLTDPNADMLLFYFTCRHTYEDALMEEIQRATKSSDKTTISSPSPGLVRVTTTDENVSLQDLDPVYALQVMPHCHVIQAESIKQLAVSALRSLGLDDESSSVDSKLAQQQLRQAPRGSLAIHALVPGMFKGQREPVMKRRAGKVGEQLVTLLKKGYPCARKRSAAASDENNSSKKWILQILLFSPEVVGVSLTECKQQQQHGLGGAGLWPNWKYPAGLANVDIEGPMPSSAYRKLLEALECQGRIPPAAVHPHDSVPAVIDLGACPGGWTKALRMLNAKVIAVDRSELHDDLMQDDMVEFIKADAFAYEPPMSISSSISKDTWMVSDVIAYPERVAQLLDRWCGGKWAHNMVVTVKFQGEGIPWEALEASMQVATGHGYRCRAKHFFNNKNEVTLMVSYDDDDDYDGDKDDVSEVSDSKTTNDPPILGRALYQPAL
jgi:23S rRNA C2498 (ribose-2'-O)-methylase RlmM